MKPSVLVFRAICAASIATICQLAYAGGPSFRLSPSEIVANINQTEVQVTRDSGTSSYAHLDPPKLLADSGEKRAFSSTYFGLDKNSRTMMLFTTSEDGQQLRQISIASISGSEAPRALLYDDMPLLMELIQTLDPQETLTETRSHSGDVLNAIVARMKHMRHGKCSIVANRVRYGIQVGVANTALGEISTFNVDATPTR